MSLLADTGDRRTQLDEATKTNTNTTTIERKVVNDISANLLRDMFNNQTLCDVTIFGAPRDGDDITNLTGIRAHKSVLASASKHLLDLFTSSGYIDSNLSEHSFENIPHDILQDMVKLLYAFQLDFDGEYDCVVERTREILIAANYLFIVDVVDACDKILSDILRLNEKNYVSTWNFARKFGAFKLMETSSRGIAQNLEKVMQQKDFLNLSVNDVGKLLLNEAVIAANAEQRCRAALTWLDYRVDSKCVECERATYARDVLNMVPIDSRSISRSIVEALSESDAVWKGAPELIRTLFRTNLKRYGPNPYVSRQTAGFERSNAWFVVGGQGSADGALFLKYDVQHMRWEFLPRLPWLRSYSSVCAFRDRIVVMGGHKNGARSSDIDEYNIATASWSSPGKKLSNVLACHAACADGERAFVFGGKKGQNVARTVESYNVSTMAVCSLASLSVARVFATATYASAIDGIFLVGGGDELFQGVLPIAKYCIGSNCWSSVGKLATPNIQMAAALMDDDLYVAGGKNHNADALSQVEIFNIHRGGTTRSAPHLTQPRVDGRAVALDRNVLCVVGGADYDDSYLLTVESFDKREGKWSTGLIPAMPQGTAFFGFASV